MPGLCMSLNPHKDGIMIESHHSQNQAIWISGLSDHHTSLFEAQEANHTDQAEHSFAASLSPSRVLGSLAKLLAVLVGKHSKQRDQVLTEKSELATERGSLQACC